MFNLLEGYPFVCSLATDGKLYQLTLVLLALIFIKAKYALLIATSSTSVKREAKILTRAYGERSFAPTEVNPSCQWNRRKLLHSWAS